MLEKKGIGKVKRTQMTMIRKNIIQSSTIKVQELEDHKKFRF